MAMTAKRLQIADRRSSDAIMVFVGEVIGLQRIARAALKAALPATVAVALQTSFRVNLRAAYACSVHAY
jgi:hypothetical protein